MGGAAKSLYNSDFVEWSARTAELLRKRRFEEVDLESLIEEVEELGNSWQRAVASHLTRMLMHIVKQKIQPERDGVSWRGSIMNAQSEIQTYLDDAPSLHGYLERKLPTAYGRAVRQAVIETGLDRTVAADSLPTTCPFSADDILSGDLDALSARLG